MTFSPYRYQYLLSISVDCQVGTDLFYYLSPPPPPAGPHRPPPLPKKFLSAPVGWGSTLPCQNRAFTEQLSLTALIYIDTGAHARHFLREKNMYWLNLFVCV